MQVCFGKLIIDPEDGFEIAEIIVKYNHQGKAWI